MRGLAANAVFKLSETTKKDEQLSNRSQYSVPGMLEAMVADDGDKNEKLQLQGQANSAKNGRR